MCKWRWLLPLLIRSCPRLRSSSSGWYLRARVSTNSGSLVVRCSSVAEENSKNEKYSNVVQKVDKVCGLFLLLLLTKDILRFWMYMVNKLGARKYAWGRIWGIKKYYVNWYVRRNDERVLHLLLLLHCFNDDSR